MNGSTEPEELSRIALIEGTTITVTGSEGRLIQEQMTTMDPPFIDFMESKTKNGFVVMRVFKHAVVGVSNYWKREEEDDEIAEDAEDGS